VGCRKKNIGVKEETAFYSTFGFASDEIKKNVSSLILQQKNDNYFCFLRIF